MLNRSLEEWEAIYGSDKAEVSLALRFAGVVKRAAAATGERVVILVDEYDKPLLQAFYGVLKSMDGYIRFALLTGVTKFGKVSVFSDLNNLMDLSMDERYTDICGVSEEELLRDFDEDIRLRTGLRTAEGGL